MSEPRQLKELRKLMPWTWDSKVGSHPPGVSAMRDFQVCSYERWSDGSTRRGRRTPNTEGHSDSSISTKKLNRGNKRQSRLKKDSKPETKVYASNGANENGNSPADDSSENPPSTGRDDAENISTSELEDTPYMPTRLQLDNVAQTPASLLADTPGISNGKMIHYENIDFDDTTPAPAAVETDPASSNQEDEDMTGTTPELGSDTQPSFSIASPLASDEVNVAAPPPQNSATAATMGAPEAIVGVPQPHLLPTADQGEAMELTHSPPAVLEDCKRSTDKLHEGTPARVDSPAEHEDDGQMTRKGYQVEEAEGVAELDKGNQAQCNTEQEQTRTSLTLDGPSVSDPQMRRHNSQSLDADRSASLSTPSFSNEGDCFDGGNGNLHNTISNSSPCQKPPSVAEDEPAVPDKHPIEPTASHDSPRDAPSTVETHAEPGDALGDKGNVQTGPAVQSIDHSSDQSVAVGSRTASSEEQLDSSAGSIQDNPPTCQTLQREDQGAHTPIQPPSLDCEEPADHFPSPGQAPQAPASMESDPPSSQDRMETGSEAVQCSPDCPPQDTEMLDVGGCNVEPTRHPSSQEKSHTEAEEVPSESQPKDVHKTSDPKRTVMDVLVDASFLTSLAAPAPKPPGQAKGQSSGQAGVEIGVQVQMSSGMQPGHRRLDGSSGGVHNIVESLETFRQRLHVLPPSVPLSLPQAPPLSTATPTPQTSGGSGDKAAAEGGGPRSDPTNNLMSQNNALRGALTETNDNTPRVQRLGGAHPRLFRQKTVPIAKHSIGAQSEEENDAPSHDYHTRRHKRPKSAHPVEHNRRSERLAGAGPREVFNRRLVTPRLSRKPVTKEQVYQQSSLRKYEEDIENRPPYPWNDPTPETLLGRCGIQLFKQQNLVYNDLDSSFRRPLLPTQPGLQATSPVSHTAECMDSFLPSNKARALMSALDYFEARKGNKSPWNLDVPSCSQKP